MFPNRNVAFLILNQIITRSNTMNKIITDRVKLIRSIQTALETDFSEPAKKVISELITTIRQNKNSHFLSISQERNGKISYAQTVDHKFDNNKR